MKKTFEVRGMSCSSCVAKIQNKLNNSAGIKKAEVNLITNSMTVDFDEEITDAKKIKTLVKRLGYDVAEKGEDEKEKKREIMANAEAAKMKKRMILSFAFLVPLLYVSMGHMANLPMPGFLSGKNNALSFAFMQFLLCLPVIAVNKKFFSGGFKALFLRSPNMDSLIAVGSGASLAYGIFEIFRMSYGMGNGQMHLVEKYYMDLYFETAAMIPALITLGKFLETLSKGRTSEAINRLMNLSPKRALVIRDGEEFEIDADELAVGDTVAVKPGMSIPADGKIVFGSTAVDESMLTGESIPAEKGVGDRVTAATINKSGYIRFEAEKVGENTSFYEIVRLVEETASKKAPIAKLADKTAGVFVPVVMVIALLTFTAWLAMGYTFESALSFGICVLVISCPCSLGLATPVAIMVGTGVGAENGILIKSGEALETAHSVNTVVFDKTGTITEGRPAVSDVFGKTQKLVNAAYALEKNSEHPIAGAVVEYCEKTADKNVASDSFEAMTGLGICGTVDGVKYFAGSARFMREHGLMNEEYEDIHSKLSKEGKTAVFFASKKSIIGGFGIADNIKPSAKKAIETLKAMHIDVIMLTGDNRTAAKEIARKVRIRQVIAEVLPADKEKEVAALMKRGKKVAMVGDGVNDSPALAAADVGMAVGTGADVAIESADIVLMHSDVNAVPNAIRLSRAVVINIKENLFWAFFYNIIGIPVAAGVLFPSFGIKLSPMFGALAMSLSSVCVVANALRLRGFKIKNNDENGERGKITMKRVYIDGMSCIHCAETVKKAFAENKIEAAVNLDGKYADIANGDDVKIKKIIEEVGYTVTKIE